MLISFVLGALILGVAQGIVFVVRDLYRRSQQRLGRRLKVVLLVDRRRRSRRRHAFWKELLKSTELDLRHRTKIRHFSISDQLRHYRNPARPLFAQSTDVMIVNWDAINGDPVYGSDRSLAFLKHYQGDMRRWLYGGGVLVVESQGASWGATQQSYDCFTSLFEGSLVELSSSQWAIGGQAIVNPAYVDHPVVRDITSAPFDLVPGGLWARRRWFPRRMFRGEQESLRFVRKHHKLLYRGWFMDWSDDWQPIVVCVNQRQPDTSQAVLLARLVEAPQASTPGLAPDRGVVILSTLFIASSELKQLVSNILNLSDHSDSFLSHSTAAQLPGPDGM